MNEIDKPVSQSCADNQIATILFIRYGFIAIIAILGFICGYGEYLRGLMKLKEKFTKEMSQLREAT